MKNFSLKLLVIPTLLTLVCWLLNTTPVIGSGKSESAVPIEVNNCDLPAPTNFHVVDIGYDYISVEWDPVTLAQAYYVEARTSNGGQLVYSTTTSNNFATLLTGPGTFDVKVAAIGFNCQNPSNNNSSIFNIRTLIVDLIATGKAEPEGTIEVYPDNNGCYTNYDNDEMYWLRAYYQGSLIATVEINWNAQNGTESECPSTNLPVSVCKAGSEGSFDAYIYEGGNELLPCAKGVNVRIKQGWTKLFDLEFDNASQFCTFYYQDPLFYSCSVWKLTSTSPPPPLSGENNATSAAVENDLITIPNPFTGDLRIQTPEPPSGPVHFRLFNLNGTSVLDQQFPARQEYNLPTAGLPPGFYLLRMESGGVSRTYKVVKAQ